MSFYNTAGIETAVKLGYDYMEAALADLNEAQAGQIDEFTALLGGLNFTCPTVNIMFPGGHTLTGEKADHQKASDYLYNVMEKVKGIGIERIVFGSGGARRVPDGYGREAAFEQLVSLCADVIAPVMKKYGVVCCVEELNSLECNILTSAAEAIKLVKLVNSPQIGLLVDYYHMCMENEPVSVLSEGGKYIKHVHIASAKNKRAYPAIGDGEDYAGFYGVLRNAGYDGRISIEGKVTGSYEEDSLKSLELLKNL
jgi:sugar phosphate isomerase/epimerase